MKLQICFVGDNRETCSIGYRTFRPGSVSARKNMDVSAKSMDDSAKKDERFGQKRWTFRPNIYLIVLQSRILLLVEVITD